MRQTGSEQNSATTRRCKGNINEIVRRDLYPLAKILAYFIAARKYGYMDMLQTAINKTAAAEAMSDALRDYLSNCGNGQKGCRKEESEKTGARCPDDIDEEKLNKAVTRFIDCLEELPPSDLVRLLKALAMTAIALAPRYKCGNIGPGGEAGS